MGAQEGHPTSNCYRCSGVGHFARDCPTFTGVRRDAMPSGGGPIRRGGFSGRDHQGPAECYTWQRTVLMEIRRPATSAGAKVILHWSAQVRRQFQELRDHPLWKRMRLTLLMRLLGTRFSLPLTLRTSNKHLEQLQVRMFSLCVTVFCTLFYPFIPPSHLFNSNLRFR